MNKSIIGNNIKVLKSDINNWEHVYIIGDVHGEYDRLVELLDKVNITSNDLVVFLGDYIDRGKDSLKTLLLVLKMAEKPNVVALRGNHEDMMLKYFQHYGVNCLAEENYVDNDWLSANGGMNTFLDLVYLYRNGIDVESILNAVENLPIVFNLGDDIFMSHAGYNAEYELAFNDIEDCVWSREEFFNNYNGKDRWFIGHTPVQYFGGLSKNPHKKIAPVPHTKNKGTITFVDTGSYLPGGRISCIDIKHNKLYQA